MCILGAILCTSADLKASRWMFYWKLSHFAVGPSVQQIFMDNDQLGNREIMLKQSLSENRKSNPTSLFIQFSCSIYLNLHYNMILLLFYVIKPLDEISLC